MMLNSVVESSKLDYIDYIDNLMKFRTIVKTYFLILVIFFFVDGLTGKWFEKTSKLWDLLHSIDQNKLFYLLEFWKYNQNTQKQKKFNFKPRLNFLLLMKFVRNSILIVCYFFD